MKASIASSSPSPSGGNPKLWKRAASTTRLARGIPATPLLVSFRVTRISNCCSTDRAMPAACAMKSVAKPRNRVLPQRFRLTLSGATTPRMRRGTPKRSRFSKVWGRAAALEVVAKAIRNGSRTARRKRRSGTPATPNARPKPASRNRTSAPQETRTNRARPANTPAPLEATVPAKAAKTASGARNITRCVKRNATATTASARSSTGRAFSPADRHARPKSRQKTRICSTSPRAIASKMLVGKAFTTRSRNDHAFTVGAAAEAKATPRPGSNSSAAPHPSSSATVVKSSKSNSDFQPSRPKSPRLPALPTARMSTPTNTGATMARIRRRKMSVTIPSEEATPGARSPQATPPAAASSIHWARERRARRAQGVGETRGGVIAPQPSRGPPPRQAPRGRPRKPWRDREFRPPADSRRIGSPVRRNP